MNTLSIPAKTQKSYFQKAYLSSFPYNLVKSGNLEKYYKILANFTFIEAKINYPEFGAQALIEDYDLIDDAELLVNPEYNTETVKALKLIQGALRLSAHVINQDTNQLVAQLTGRLLYFDASEIKALLQQIPQTASPWLRSLTGSLTPPGGALVRTLSGHKLAVNAVTVTPDGKYIISASGDKTLKVWDLYAGEENLTLSGHENSVKAVTVTPDGKYIISGSSDKTLKVWDLHTNAVAMAPDGKHAISGSLDTTVKVWDLYSHSIKFNLRGHRDSVNAVAISCNGKYALSASSDSTLKVWDLNIGKEITCFTGDSGLISCAFAPDGITILAGEASGRLHFLRLEGIET